MKIIDKSVGSGGKSSNDFINNFILKHLGNDILNNLRDASIINFVGDKLVISTDSFTVSPEFFPGGDIGKLAVYGTINDIAVSGGIPKYLTLSFVIPNGYFFEKIERIILSIKDAVNESGVLIISGDTKVVDGLDGIIINTTGIGELKRDLNDYGRIEIGDKVIFTSDLGRHAAAILLARGELGFDGKIESDCCNLYNVISKLDYSKIKFARDATRGGVAAVLNEILNFSKKGFLIKEKNVPVRDDVKYLFEMIGFDYFQMANEGVAVLIVEKGYEFEAVSILKEIKEGQNAAVVGEVISENRVVLETEIGGKRTLDMPLGELLPRIC